MSTTTIAPAIIPPPAYLTPQTDDHTLVPTFARVKVELKADTRTQITPAALRAVQTAAVKMQALNQFAGAS